VESLTCALGSAEAGCGEALRSALAGAAMVLGSSGPIFMVDSWPGRCQEDTPGDMDALSAALAADFRPFD
jgi:hypothetical protein